MTDRFSFPSFDNGRFQLYLLTDNSNPVKTRYALYSKDWELGRVDVYLSGEIVVQPNDVGEIYLKNIQIDSELAILIEQ
ncbi:TPA: hypothetical protein QDB06_000839 [Burkholderia vietnamiensis]|nr:hypothetical protein [Burkholderia vietnamiensis]